MVGKRYLVLGLLTCGLLLNGVSVVMAEETERETEKEAVIPGMEHYSHTYLPIGSVVVMKEENIPLMIQGYAFTSGEGEHVYDYCGSIFPSGFESMDNSFCFDQDEIAKVLYIGYIGENSEEFLSFMDEKMKEVKSNDLNLESELENVLQQTEVDQTETAPENEGKPNIEIDEETYYIPSSINDWLDKGWILSDIDRDIIVEADGTCMVNLSKGDYAVTLFAYNSGKKEAPLVDCEVNELDIIQQDEENPIVFLNNIKTGMKEKSLRAFLTETSYGVEDVSDDTINIYLDLNQDKVLTVYMNKGKVCEFDYRDNSVFR